MIGLVGFLLFLWASFQRWWRSLTAWRLIMSLVVLAALAGAAVAPFMGAGNRSWWRLESWWAAMGEGAGLLIVFALILRYEKEFFRALSRREVSHAYQVRMADLAGLVDRAAVLDLRKSGEVEKFRIDVLRCVMSGIAEQLELDPTSLTVNLLVLTAKEPRTMVVVARSDNLRPIGTEHLATDGLPAWRAIVSGAIEIENDLRRTRPSRKRPYRSVVAIPVAKGEAAYGGLSIDCTSAYAFYGHQRRIYCQCRPYIALLSLTFGQTSPYHECRFNPHYSG